MLTLSSMLENLLRQTNSSFDYKGKGVFHLLKLLKVYQLAREPQLDILKNKDIMSSEIHSTAIIGESAILGRNLRIGPYAIIENGSVLGDGCNIESHSVIKASATLKDNVRVGHFSVVGGDPQHLL